MPMPANPTRPATVVVVGAGVSGVICARHLIATGCQVVVVEGGPASQFLASHRFQAEHVIDLHKDLVELLSLPDFGAPAGASPEQLREYLLSYVDAFALRKHIIFSCRLEHAQVADDGRWSVVCSDLLEPGRLHRLACDCLVISSGACLAPPMPQLPGMHDFPGISCHSRALLGAGGGNSSAAAAADGGVGAESQQSGHEEALKEEEGRSEDEGHVEGRPHGAAAGRVAVAGKAVVVLGDERTAVACARRAVEGGASSVTLVYRQPHWPLPDALLGKALPRLAYSRVLPRLLLPPYYTANAAQRVLSAAAAPLRRLFWWRVQRRQAAQFGGMDADTRPPLNLARDMLYSAQATGDTDNWVGVLRDSPVQLVRGDVAKLSAQGVHLRSGVVLPADVLVHCSQPTRTYAVFDPELRMALGIRKDGLHLYRSLVPPLVPSLAFLGAESSSPLSWLTTSLQSAWLAALFSGRMALPGVRAMKADVFRQRRWRRRVFPPQHGRGSLVQWYAQLYHDQLLRDLGLPHRVKSGRLVGDCFGLHTPQDYQPVFASRLSSRPPAAGAAVHTGAPPATLAEDDALFKEDLHQYNEAVLFEGDEEEEMASPRAGEIMLIPAAAGAMALLHAEGPSPTGAPGPASLQAAQGTGAKPPATAATVPGAAEAKPQQLSGEERAAAQGACSGDGPGVPGGAAPHEQAAAVLPAGASGVAASAAAAAAALPAAGAAAAGRSSARSTRAGPPPVTREPSNLHELPSLDTVCPLVADAALVASSLADPRTTPLGPLRTHSSTPAPAPAPAPASPCPSLGRGGASGLARVRSYAAGTAALVRQSSVTSLGVARTGSLGYPTGVDAMRARRRSALDPPTSARRGSMDPYGLAQALALRRCSLDARADPVEQHIRLVLRQSQHTHQPALQADPQRRGSGSTAAALAGASLPRVSANSTVSRVSSASMALSLMQLQHGSLQPSVVLLGDAHDGVGVSVGFLTGELGASGLVLDEGQAHGAEGAEAAAGVHDGPQLLPVVRQPPAGATYGAAPVASPALPAALQLGPASGSCQAQHVQQAAQSFNSGTAGTLAQTCSSGSAASPTASAGGAADGAGAEARSRGLLAPRGIAAAASLDSSSGAPLRKALEQQRVQSGGSRSVAPPEEHRALHADQASSGAGEGSASGRSYAQGSSWPGPAQAPKPSGASMHAGTVAVAAEVAAASALRASCVSPGPISAGRPPGRNLAALLPPCMAAEYEVIPLGPAEPLPGELLHAYSERGSSRGPGAGAGAAGPAGLQGQQRSAELACMGAGVGAARKGALAAGVGTGSSGRMAPSVHAGPHAASVVAQQGRGAAPAAAPVGGAAPHANRTPSGIFDPYAIPTAFLVGAEDPVPTTSNPNLLINTHTHTAPWVPHRLSSSNLPSHSDVEGCRSQPLPAHAVTYGMARALDMSTGTGMVPSTGTGVGTGTGNASGSCPQLRLSPRLGAAAGAGAPGSPTPDTQLVKVEAGSAAGTRPSTVCGMGPGDPPGGGAHASGTQTAHAAGTARPPSAPTVSLHTAAVPLVQPAHAGAGQPATPQPGPAESAAGGSLVRASAPHGVPTPASSSLAVDSSAQLVSSPSVLLASGDAHGVHPELRHPLGGQLVPRTPAGAGAQPHEPQTLCSDVLPRRASGRFARATTGQIPASDCCPQPPARPSGLVHASEYPRYALSPQPAHGTSRARPGAAASRRTTSNGATSGTFAVLLGGSYAAASATVGATTRASRVTGSGAGPGSQQQQRQRRRSSTVVFSSVLGGEDFMQLLDVVGTGDGRPEGVLDVQGPASTAPGSRSLLLGAAYGPTASITELVMEEGEEEGAVARPDAAAASTASGSAGVRSGGADSSARHGTSSSHSAAHAVSVSIGLRSARYSASGALRQPRSGGYGPGALAAGSAASGDACTHRVAPAAPYVRPPSSPLGGSREHDTLSAGGSRLHRQLLGMGAAGRAVTLSDGSAVSVPRKAESPPARFASRGETLPRLSSREDGAVSNPGRSNSQTLAHYSPGDREDVVESAAIANAVESRQQALLGVQQQGRLAQDQPPHTVIVTPDAHPALALPATPEAGLGAATSQRLDASSVHDLGSSTPTAAPRGAGPGSSTTPRGSMAGRSAAPSPAAAALRAQRTSAGETPPQHFAMPSGAASGCSSSSGQLHSAQQQQQQPDSEALQSGKLAGGKSSGTGKLNKAWKKLKAALRFTTPKASGGALAAGASTRGSASGGTSPQAGWGAGAARGSSPFDAAAALSAALAAPPSGAGVPQARPAVSQQAVTTPPPPPVPHEVAVALDAAALAPAGRQASWRALQERQRRAGASPIHGAGTSPLLPTEASTAPEPSPRASALPSSRHACSPDPRGRDSHAEGAAHEVARSGASFHKAISTLQLLRNLLGDSSQGRPSEPDRALTAAAAEEQAVDAWAAFASGASSRGGSRPGTDTGFKPQADGAQGPAGQRGSRPSEPVAPAAHQSAVMLPSSGPTGPAALVTRRMGGVRRMSSMTVYNAASATAAVLAYGSMPPSPHDPREARKPGACSPTLAAAVGAAALGARAHGAGAVEGVHGAAAAGGMQVPPYGDAGSPEAAAGAAQLGTGAQPRAGRLPVRRSQSCIMEPPAEQLRAMKAAQACASASAAVNGGTPGAAAALRVQYRTATLSDVEAAAAAAAEAAAEGAAHGEQQGGGSPHTRSRLGSGKSRRGSLLRLALGAMGSSLGGAGGSGGSSGHAGGEKSEKGGGERTGGSGASTGGVWEGGAHMQGRSGGLPHPRSQDLQDVCEGAPLEDPSNTARANALLTKGAAADAPRAARRPVKRTASELTLRLFSGGLSFSARPQLPGAAGSSGLFAQGSPHSKLHSPAVRLPQLAPSSSGLSSGASETLVSISNAPAAPREGSHAVQPRVPSARAPRTTRRKSVIAELLHDMDMDGSGPLQVTATPASFTGTIRLALEAEGRGRHAAGTQVAYASGVQYDPHAPSGVLSVQPARGAVTGEEDGAAGAGGAGGVAGAWRGAPGMRGSSGGGAPGRGWRAAAAALPSVLLTHRRPAAQQAGQQRGGRDGEEDDE